MDMPRPAVSVAARPARAETLSVTLRLPTHESLPLVSYWVGCIRVCRGVLRPQMQRTNRGGQAA